MYVIYAMGNMAGTYIFSSPYLQEGTDSADWSFTLTLESAAASDEAAAAEAAARLQRMGITWLQPLTKAVGPWKVDRSKLAVYFSFTDRTWLRGEQVVRPFFDRTEHRDRKLLLLKFMFAPDGPLAWEYGSGTANGWSAVNRLVSRIQSILESSVAVEDLQQVGLLSRDLTIALAQTVLPPGSDPSEPGPADSKRRLDLYFQRVLSEDRKEYMALASAVHGLANHLQHKRSATFFDAELCGRTAIALAHIVRIVAQRNEGRTEGM